MHIVITSMSWCRELWCKQTGRILASGQIYIAAMRYSLGLIEGIQNVILLDRIV